LEENIAPELVSTPETPSSPSLIKRLAHFLLDAFEILLMSVILLAVINALSARVRVNGSSMSPTLVDGQYLLVNKLAYRWAPLEHGDVVVFYFPLDPSEEYIKRLIGLPGDHIQIQEGRVYVNGILLREDYISAMPLYYGEWQVPEDSYFVLGDNRNNSSDSHNWGMVPKNHIIGKAILVYWPISKISWVTHVDLLTITP
jgi:signal peptidase I